MKGVVNSRNVVILLLLLIFLHSNCKGQNFFRKNILENFLEKCRQRSIQEKNRKEFGNNTRIINTYTYIRILHNVVKANIFMLCFDVFSIRWSSWATGILWKNCNDRCKEQGRRGGRCVEVPSKCKLTKRARQCQCY